MATRIWTGLGLDANWSTALNWDGGVAVPATVDTVLFNSTSTKSCTVDALGTWSGGALSLQNNYTGTVTLATNIVTGTFSIAEGTFVQGIYTFQSGTFGITVPDGKVGTFTGGSGVMTTTSVTIGIAGTTGLVNVQATSNTWNSGSWTATSTTGLTWNNGGGTVKIVAAATVNASALTFNAGIIDVAGGGGGVTISNGTTFPLGANPTSSVVTFTLTVTGTVTCSGTWTHSGTLTISATTGTVSGALTNLAFDQSLTINATATFPTGVALAWTGSSATATLTATATTFSTSTLSRTNTTVIAASTTLPLGLNPTTSTGTSLFTITGTVTASGAWTHGGPVTVSASTGVVSGITSLSINNTLTVASTGTWETGASVTVTGTVNASLDATTAVFGTVTFNRSTGTASTFTVTAGTTVPLGVTPTINLGSGNVTWSGNFSATGTISYTGGAVTLGAATVATGTFTWKHLSAVNFTVNAATTWPATGGIWFSVTAAGTRTFAGASKTYASFRRSGSNGALVAITGTNTFGTFIDNDAQVAHSITFPNVTTTVGSFIVRGATGKLVTLQRTGGAGTFTLAKSTAGDVNEVGFISVSNSTVDASPIWYAGVTPPSVDGGGNTNWIFTAPPAEPKFRKAAVLV